MTVLATTDAAPPVPVASLPPWWADTRMQLPLALVAATVLASGTFAALHFWLRGRSRAPDEGARDDVGFAFADAGYVICPQSEGLIPTRKEIDLHSTLIVSLGSPAGQIVEPVWARVVEVDPRDRNRIAVVLVGQTTSTGQRDLQTDRHGFRLAQKIWITKDCVWDVLRPLDEPSGRLLCGAELVAFASEHPELATTLGPAPVPGAAKTLVGRKVELFMVSRAGAGTAWQIPLTAEILDVGNTGHVPTVKLVAFGRNDWAEQPPPSGHALAPGQIFDITWDCVLQYL